MINLFENIDSDLTELNVEMVKTSELQVAQEYGIDGQELPEIVYFENGIPSLYPGMCCSITTWEHQCSSINAQNQ